MGFMINDTIFILEWSNPLTMFLLPFWALNVSDVLLSMQGQKALRFHQKYQNLCSEGLTGLEQHEGEFSFLGELSL